MSVLQFRLKSLFMVVTVAALLTFPTHQLVVNTMERWNPKNNTGAVQLPPFTITPVTTTISVPDGEIVLSNGIKLLSQGRGPEGGRVTLK